jgi:hypothetical protein
MVAAPEGSASTQQMGAALLHPVPKRGAAQDIVSDCPAYRKFFSLPEGGLIGEAVRERAGAALFGLTPRFAAGLGGTGS